MKRIFDCADQYIQSSDWKMLSLLKFCLCAIGVLFGLSVGTKNKKVVAAGALGVFVTSYVTLMADFLGFAIEFFKSDHEC